MIIAGQRESYLNFIDTIHLLDVPKESWNIIFKPTSIIYQVGQQRLEQARKQGFSSLYFATPNPLLLEEQPFEEIVISDDEETPPSSSPPVDSPPSPSPMFT